MSPTMPRVQRLDEHHRTRGPDRVKDDRQGSPCNVKKTLRGGEVDWTGWALFGLIATTALTAVMIIAQLAGLTRLDIPLLLGTMVTEDPDKARVRGSPCTCSSGKGSPSATPLSSHCSARQLGGSAPRWASSTWRSRSRCSSPCPGIHPRLASAPRAGRAPQPWNRRDCSASTTGARHREVAIAAHLVYGIALGVLLHRAERCARQLRASVNDHSPTTASWATPDFRPRRIRRVGRLAVSASLRRRPRLRPSRRW